MYEVCSRFLVAASLWIGGTTVLAFALPTHSLADENLLIEIHPAILGLHETEFSDRRVTTEELLGVCSQGTSVMQGTLGVESGAADRTCIVFRGSVDTLAVGRRGPVQVRTSSRMNVTLAGELSLGVNGLSFQATEVSPQIVQLQLCEAKSDHCGPIGKLAERRASIRFEKQKPDVKAIVEYRAGVRLRQSFSEAIGEKLDSFDTELHRIKHQLQEQNAPLQRLGMSTHDNGRVTVSALIGDLRPTTEIPLSDASDLSRNDVRVVVHQDVFGRLALQYAGKRVEGERLVQDLLEVSRMVGADFARPEGDMSWAVQFAAEEPVCIEFGEQQSAITFRFERFESDGRIFPDPMEVRVVYSWIETDDPLAATRDGTIRVDPAGFAPESGRRIPGRLLAQRTVMKRRFEQVFSDRVEFRSTAPLGPLHDATLVLRKVESQNGWATTTWRVDRK